MPLPPRAPLDVAPVAARSDPPVEVARRHRSRAAVGWAVLAGVLLALLTGVVAFRWGSDEAGVSVADLPVSSPGSTEPAPAISDIYATVLPSVVVIQATTGAAGSAPTTGDTTGGPATTGGTSLGTGVVANGDGSILTALHVVAGAEQISVTFADGTESAATVVATEPADDIALLMPQTLPSVLVPAVIGGSAPAVGDQVVAVGNPLGLTFTATAGVVSALDRSATTETGSIDGLIQFDAAVNHGSSGGPLLDSTGATIGIVVALANPTDAETFIGIGFAVPIGTAVVVGREDGPDR